MWCSLSVSFTVCLTHNTHSLYTRNALCLCLSFSQKYPSLSLLSSWIVTNTWALWAIIATIVVVTLFRGNNLTALREELEGSASGMQVRQWGGVCSRRSPQLGGVVDIGLTRDAAGGVVELGYLVR